jgi:DHA1 family tetracycline resistance protein-like MFS transporter
LIDETISPSKTFRFYDSFSGGGKEKEDKEHQPLLPSNSSNCDDKGGTDRKSYVTILLLHILYGISFSLLIPALPALALQLTQGDAVRASMIYGFATSIRYFLEFFSSPILGTLGDIKGRKIIYCASFLINSIEFLLLCFFPSIVTIFVTRILSGMFDGGIAIAYTMITDIAIYNNDIISQQFGILASMIGLSFIIGPLMGGYLVMVNIQLAFGISSFLAFLGSILTWFFLEETMLYRRKRANSLITSPSPQEGLDEEARVTAILLIKEDDNAVSSVASSNSTFSLIRNLNPLNGLKIHLSNPKLKKLSIPLALCSMNSSSHFIWFLFVKYRFPSITPSMIGLFISFHGLMSAISQGLLLKILIPKYCSEKNALLYGLILAALQAIFNGFASSVIQLFVFSVVFSLSIIHFPALKALIVNESLKNKNGLHYQANLQGAISSIRTISMSIGSLLFSSLFSIGISFPSYPIPYLPFLVVGLFYFCTYFYLVKIGFSEEIDEPETKDIILTVNIAEGMLPDAENELLK